MVRSTTQTMHTRAASMRRVAFGNDGNNATLSQRLSMGCRIVAAIPLHAFRTAARASRLPTDRWNGFDQGNQLGHIVGVRTGQKGRQGNALRIRNEVVLAARFRSVCGVGTCFFPHAGRAPKRYRRWRVTNQSDRLAAVSSAAVHGSVARHPPLATRVNDANTSCPNHSPIPGANIPKEDRFSAQTGCPSTLDDSRSVCVPGNVFGAV